MRLGIDLDNTIVCYDSLFHALAVERGLVPPQTARRKQVVRDHLLATARERVWSALQGEAYGRAMHRATPFVGALETVRECVLRGMTVFIISHRSRRPYSGPEWDLHRAAYEWLAAVGFFDADAVGLPREHVFFEESAAAKLQRIGELRCTHFIDDLPEFLADPSFPADTVRIHFGAHGGPADGAKWITADSWTAIARVLLDSGDAAA